MKKKTIRDYDKERCLKCKHGIVHYNKFYGGFIVGCDRSDPNFKGDFGKQCFEQKD